MRSIKQSIVLLDSHENAAAHTQKEMKRKEISFLLQKEKKNKKKKKVNPMNREKAREARPTPFGQQQRECNNVPMREYTLTRPIVQHIHSTLFW